jgi:hypothetical protein
MTCGAACAFFVLGNGADAKEIIEVDKLKWTHKTGHSLAPFSFSRCGFLLLKPLRLEFSWR